jgi:hypothetical protein
MSQSKPFCRNYRPITNSTNAGWSEIEYIRNREYCKNPEHYTRAFLLIQKDMLDLFQYIEQSDSNLKTNSFRIYELLVRICIEIETNFKAILKENIFEPKYKNGKKNGQLRKEDVWNINDYNKINLTHHLDAYKVKYPIWRGKEETRVPFANWKDGKSPEWYQAYNKVKHDRNNNFEEASFKNLIDAFAGLFILLSSQFKNEDFTTGTDTYTSGGSYYDGQFGIGNYLIVEFPNDWEKDELYEFDWKELLKEEEKIKKYNYD